MAWEIMILTILPFYREPSPGRLLKNCYAENEMPQRWGE